MLLQGYVLVLVGVTVLAMFKIHDYQRSQVVSMPVGVTFPRITKKDFDSSFLHFTGYMINYGFIKFGLEV